MSRIFLEVLKFALIYDFIFSTRGRIRSKEICVWCEDFLYWICCTVRIFQVMQEYGDGIMRWYCLISAGMAVLVYKKIIKKYPVKWICHFMRKLLLPINRMAESLKGRNHREKKSSLSKEKI